MSKEDSLRKKVFVVWPLTLLVYGIMLFMLAFVLGLFWIIGSKIIEKIILDYNIQMETTMFYGLVLFLTLIIWITTIYALRVLVKYGTRLYKAFEESLTKSFLQSIEKNKWIEKEILDDLKLGEAFKLIGLWTLYVNSLFLPIIIGITFFSIMFSSDIMVTLGIPWFAIYVMGLILYLFPNAFVRSINRQITNLITNKELPKIIKK
ncbi:hypothetical protein LCGC14_1068330 [marine sediment metagenome]|uniref:Uncharacterized protein n=1 Tax=marine sediment metagenome TaxID=412755 RepID=A0A0F9Q267_9ZZZZ